MANNLYAIDLGKISSRSNDHDVVCAKLFNLEVDTKYEGKQVSKNSKAGVKNRRK